MRRSSILIAAFALFTVLGATLASTRTDPEILRRSVFAIFWTAPAQPSRPVVEAPLTQAEVSVISRLSGATASN